MNTEKKRNTTQVGNEFEIKAFDIINRVIQQEQLGHCSKYIKLFQKKGYYSALRKKDIIFDITIEVWPPGANRYVLLYVIECKSYDTKVPVNDVEEFHHKIQQISGVNEIGRAHV